MDIGLLETFFMWCSLINVSLLLLGFVVWLCASDRIYALHGRWFRMPRETVFCLSECRFLLVVFKINWSFILNSSVSLQFHFQM